MFKWLTSKRNKGKRTPPKGSNTVSGGLRKTPDDHIINATAMGLLIDSEPKRSPVESLPPSMDMPPSSRHSPEVASPASSSSSPSDYSSGSSSYSSGSYDSGGGSDGGGF